MALLHIEAFDTLAADDLSAAGYSISDVTQVTFPGGYIKLGTQSTARMLRKAVPTNAAVTIGVRWKADSYGTPGKAIVSAFGVSTTESGDNGTASKRAINYVVYDDNAKRVQVYHNGSAIASSVNGETNIPVGTAAYFEVSYDPGAAALTVKVNGVTKIAMASGANPASLTLDLVIFGLEHDTTLTKSNVSYNDFYIRSGFETFYGEGTVIARLPTSDTARNDFTPSAGTDNFAMVDETDPDGDVTYNEANAVGDQDRYASNTDIGNPLTIFGVMVRSFIRKTDVADRTARNVLKSGAATSNGADLGLATTYVATSTVVENNPNGSVPWTAAAVEASEFGAEITS